MTEFNAKKHCGGKTRAGTKCLRPKGWKTSHPGSGRCAFHGGASPNGAKAAGKERALEFARGMLGAEVSGSPLDAMQEAVGLSRGLVAFYRHELATLSLVAAGKDVSAAERARQEIRALAGPYSDAIRLERDVSKAAIDTGIAERRQRMAEADAERLVEAISSGLQEAFGDLATPARQALFARVVRDRLVVLEGEARDVPVQRRHLTAAV